MTTWNKCDMEFYPAEYEYGKTDCIVNIDNGDIRVEYRGGKSLLIFEGDEHGISHYRLKATTHEGRGTLHLLPSNVPDDAVLEGWYYEDKQRGMWRIHLSN